MPAPVIRERITVCQLLFSLGVGGAEVLATDIAEAGGDEFRFVFGCLDRAGPLADQLRKSGHIVEVFHRKPGFDLRCVRHLATFLKKQNVSLVHAHQCDPFLYSALTRLFGVKSPILLTEHGRLQPDVRKWKRVVLNRLLLRRTDIIVGVGRCLNQPLVENEGFPPDRIGVIYNGRDLERFQFNEAVRSEVRQSLGYSDQHFLVMHVARLSPEKDHAVGIRAIGRLASRRPSVRQVIVGDGPERSRIEALVADLGLQDRVTLLGARHDVERLLSAADLLVLTSLNEAIPLTLIEAMAAGLPCVASRVGGVPEVIVDGESGLLAEAQNDGQFAACIETLITSPEMRRKMGRAARQRAEELFDKETMTSTYFGLYREMLAVADRRQTNDSAYCVVRV